MRFLCLGFPPHKTPPNKKTPRQRTKQDWGAPQRLSLDEFSRRKGKGRFATVLVDLDKSSLLEVIDFKGLKNRGLLLSNNQSLSEQEIQDLSELLHQSPLLSIAYELKEDLRDIYESNLSVNPHSAGKNRKSGIFKE